MTAEPARIETGNGLKNLIDIIIAPSDALESLGTVPTWGWAFLITVVLIALGTFLTTPAIVHAFTSEWPAQVARDPRLAAQSPDQQAFAEAFGLKIVNVVWIFAAISVPFFFLITTVIMTVFNAIGRGKGSFGTFWAASCNIGIIAGLGSLVLGIIVVARGPASFNTSSSVQLAMPSLGWLVPGGGVHLLAFLGAVTPFSLWAVWLTAQAMLIVARVPRLHAWLTGAFAFLVPALFAALGAH